MKRARGGRLFAAPALAAALAASALAACDAADDAPKPADTNGATTGGGGAAPDASAPPEHTWTECQASDQAFIRKAIVALLGRRPWGQAEVNAWEDVLHAVRAADLAAAGPLADLGAAAPPHGQDLPHARAVVVRAMMQEDAYRQRWSDFCMDALHVVRVETKSMESCYGTPSAGAIDDGSLAAYVRDHDALSSQSPPIAGFTMGQLLSSALELDDLSPVYRAHLFAMMSRPYTAANVGPNELERSRRQNFGAIFESAYIHRDLVCLSCHNSDFSVTYDEDPAKNRAWPVPGSFERALYGSSNGLHDPSEAATKGSDELRSRSMLRYMGVGPDAILGGGGVAPYGWNGGACGTFFQPGPDPLGVDTYFGSLRSTKDDPTAGQTASVWGLERALRRGVDRLAAHGLIRLQGGQLADADEAFAYLVAENVVEEVWTEVMGARLTIANYFPRTEVQRDILTSLTEGFVASHFSLKRLLEQILAHPAFNLKAPEEGCGSAPYELPNVFDPWTTAEADVGKRGNSPADGIFAISARPLRRSLHRAMGWPFSPEYPEKTPTEETFQVAIGDFLKDAEPGFRGLDFQGRLTWEATYGKCAPLASPDFIDVLVARAQETPGATVADAVIALKDRLVGEPWIEPTAEKPELEALVKTKLDDTSLAALGPALRSVCGVLVSTPDFMLGGIAPKDTREVPRLTPPEASYSSMCADIAARVEGYMVTCGDGAASATKP